MHEVIANAACLHTTDSSTCYATLLHFCRQVARLGGKRGHAANLDLMFAPAIPEMLPTSVVGVHELCLGLLQHLQPRKQLLPAARSKQHS